MDIIIANPPWYYQEKDKWRFGIRSGSRWPFTVPQEKDFLIRYRPFPFWLAYTQALLLKKNINSIFVDSIARGDTYEQFYNMVFHEHPQYVFFEMSTPSYKNDIMIAKELHKMGVKVLIGGTHATVFAKELLKKESIFAIFKGEYEFSLLHFLKKDPTSGIKETIEFDINTLPFPHRDENIIWQYRERTHDFTPFQISILTSRGCPYLCSFCQWPKVMYNKKIRFRDLFFIEKEILELKRRFGKDIYIYVDDDTFNLNEERSIEISDIFAKHKLKWGAMCRIDTTSKKGWKKLYDNGLRHVNIGIESASQQLLNTINKKLNIEKAEEKIKFLNKIGMHIHLTFMFGIPGETKKDIEMTKNFFDRVNVASKQQSKCIPLPGTTWWESLNKEERNRDFDGYKTLIGRL